MPKTYNDERERKKWDKANATISQINKNDRISRQVEALKKNIQGANTRKVVASVALCWYYSARAQETFARFQGFDSFWANRTNAAYNLVFSGVIESASEIGFLLAHGVEYGIYLELANDRKHEALWPIIKELDSQFSIDLHKIWS